MACISDSLDVTQHDFKGPWVYANRKGNPNLPLCWPSDIKMSVVDEEHDDFDIPLHHKQAFGAGLKRQAVAFVRATSPELSTTKGAASTASGPSVGDLYLNLVLSKEAESGPESASKDTEPGICPVCGLIKGPEPEVLDTDGRRSESSRKHEASIAHQVCLTHSHPPSAIDRSRKGLAYLESYGWDPDARQGLGLAGQGIQYPIKVKQKDDTLGLGLVIPKEIRDRVTKKQKPEKLNAKECRKMAEEDKKRTEKLRRQLFSSDDVEKYLGLGA